MSRSFEQVESLSCTRELGGVLMTTRAMFMLPVLGLVACGAPQAGFLTEKAACGQGPRDWKQTDLTYALLHAELDGDGNWQFAAPMTWARYEALEGFWDADAGEGSLVLHGSSDAVLMQTEMALTGTIEPNGDYDLQVVAASHFREAPSTQNTYAIRQGGCELVETALDEAGEPGISWRTAWDRDGGTRETEWQDGTYLGLDEMTWAREGVYTRNVDRSYPDWIVQEVRDETRDYGLGETNGEYAWELVNGERTSGTFFRRYDGARDEAWRKDYPSGEFEDCQVQVESDGSWTETCVTPQRACTKVSDGTECTMTCDDGGGPWPC